MALEENVIPGDFTEANQWYEIMNHSLSQHKRFLKKGDKQKSREWLESFHEAKKEYDEAVARKNEDDQVQLLLADLRKRLTPHEYHEIERKVLGNESEGK